MENVLAHNSPHVKVHYDSSCHSNGPLRIEGIRQVYVAEQGGPRYAASAMAYDMYLEAFGNVLTPNYGAASANAVLLTLTFGFAAYMVNKMTKM